VPSVYNDLFEGIKLHLVAFVSRVLSFDILVALGKLAVVDL